MRRNEGIGRAEFLRAKTSVPLAVLGLGRSTQPHSLRGGSISPHPSPAVSWNWTSSLENWNKSQHCSFFRSFVLDICISRYGKLPLKAAGVRAHWTGSGAKGEPGPKGGRGGRGLPVTVIQLVPKAECECSPLTSKKGREKESEVQIELGVSEG